MGSQDLMFPLVVEDGWPPVAKECLIATKVDSGFRIEVAPFFVKDVSAGDVISVVCDSSGDVLEWAHILRSARSTIWVLVFDDYDIDTTLQRLRALNCNVEELRKFQFFSIDVPAECNAKDLDECLATLDDNSTAIAYPSFRH